METTVYFEQPVEPLPEAVRQRNDLLIVYNQQQQVANSVVDGNALLASLQVFFNHSSPLRRNFSVKVRREFTNDLLAADDYAHVPRFTLSTAIRSLRERYKNNEHLLHFGQFER